jgi:DNA (cytosine-5)-methyltransferase 1
MDDIAQLMKSAALAPSELCELLGIAEAQRRQYESGAKKPSPREIQILKGMALRIASKDAIIPDDSSRKVREIKLKSASRSKRKNLLTSLELCAGAGGAALGLEYAGFDPVALIEIDRHACATLRKNRPYWNVIQADMRRYDASYWKAEGVDLLSGGLPCPPFSIAGKQLGSDDERDMFPSMLRIVKEAKPRAILIENVRGILTSKFDSFRAKVDSALNREGFDTFWTGMNAAHFGVPQQRFRAFLVALRRGHTSPLNWPIAPVKQLATVGGAIFDLMASRGWKGAEDWMKKASAPAPTIVGGSKKHGGPDLGPTRARREWAELGIDGLGLADLPPSADFKGMPRLTIPMVAKLQSFPENWEFVGGKTNAYRQVGNALPVQLAASVAAAVKDSLL